MRLTNRDKSNLARFGCAFQPSQNLVYIKLTDTNREQVLAATILARPIYVLLPKGPLVCLALEISPTRALASSTEKKKDHDS